MISFTTRGDYLKTESWLRGLKKVDVRSVLESAGRDGVAALAAGTPVDSGLAASSWDYAVTSTHTGMGVTWTNNDVENGFPVAIALQYGYGTGTGGYVAGRDYINPAMKPIFDSIADRIWKAVKSA